MHSFDTWDSWLNWVPNVDKLPVQPHSPWGNPLNCSLRVAKGILKKHNDTHHLEPSRIVHNYMVWVNNKTKEPCVINPCSICIRLKEIGLPIYNFVLEKEKSHA
jgi:hypothetical protein